MGNKYQPLRLLFEELTQRGENQATFRFDDLDQVVGGLPASSRKYREWWSNSSQPHGEASWRAAGWLVESVSFDAGTVRFERGAASVEPQQRPAGSPSAPSRKVFDWDILPVADRSEIRTVAEWRTAGAITIADGQLVFPRLPAMPGLYRMSLTGRPAQSRARIYFGETDNLQRRASGYRNPFETQTTNLRLNAAIRSHLDAGGVVRLDIATVLHFHPPTADASAVTLDLSRKAVRVLGESAALVLAQLDGAADIENLE